MQKPHRTSKETFYITIVMSRSFKKTPISGNCVCRSEKQDKRIANRRLRRAEKQAIKIGKDLPLVDEISNVWDFGKDGKHYMKEPDEKDMRK